MDYIAIAIAPGIAICLYIFYKDVYNREPAANLVISFIMGCLALLPAIFFERTFAYFIDGTVMGVAIFSYAIVAFSEETSKFLGLRLYSYNQKSFDEPLDGIVYSVMVSMGFATIENVRYVLQYAELGLGYKVGLQRMFLSVPAHATFAVVMGYYIGKAKFNERKRIRLMLAGILGAIFFHGTFDFFLFIHQYSFWGRNISEVLLAAGAISSFVVALVLSRKLIRSQRNLSERMFKEKNTTITGV
jgi:RsiW-degrading membrane proteinase PrsW (M82 family)